MPIPKGESSEFSHKYQAAFQRGYFDTLRNKGAEPDDYPDELTDGEIRAYQEGGLKARRENEEKKPSQ